MKKILFVNKSFAIGGIQSSMINMANTLSKNYEVYLFVYYPYGPLKNRLNSNISIIKSNWMFNSMGMSFKECLKKGSLKQVFFRVFATVWAKIFNNKFPINIAIKHQGNLGSFDYAIAYHHEFEKKKITSGFNRVLLKIVNAKQKVSWIHNDSVANPVDEDFNDYYYSKMDKIVCVSNSVKESFITQHPNINKKNIKVCYNFLDFVNIDKMACEEPKSNIPRNKDFIFFSACRLVEEKGFPRAIKAFSQIFLKNNIIWYIAGDGNEREKIEKEISKYNLEKKVILLGKLENPYSYMKYADVLLLCSYYEAAPMLYSEAKYFKKPVFTTHISSSNEMLENGKYGIICNNNETDMTASFSQFVSNKSEYDLIKKNLNSVTYNENTMIQEFEAIFK